MRTKWILNAGGAGAWGTSTNGNRSCTLLPEVPVQPAEHRLVPQLAVERFQHPVSFILEHQRFGSHAVPAQRGEELQPLIDRHAEVQLVGDHERRRLDGLREEM